MRNRTLLACVPAVALSALVGLRVPSAAGEDPPKPVVPAAPLEPREKKLVEMLENAVLKGRWRLVEGGNLGAEADDSYSIQSIEKARGAIWIVKARIRYAEKDITVPVPVEVYWAGDTPVLAITDKGIPGLGTYTARVLLYGGHYTGTWSGPGHAGFLSGVIEKAAAAPVAKDKRQEAKDKRPDAKDEQPEAKDEQQG